MQVVTCEKMKMSGRLRLVPRDLGMRLTKPSGALFPGFITPECKYVYAQLHVELGNKAR